MFTTERLTLRGYRDSDFPHFLAMASDIRTLPYVTRGFVAPISDNGKYRERLEGLVKDSLTSLIIETKPTETEPESKWVGAVFINPTGPPQQQQKNRDGSIGISLVYEFTSKGYGRVLLADPVHRSDQNF